MVVLADVSVEWAGHSTVYFTQYVFLLILFLGFKTENHGLPFELYYVWLKEQCYYILTLPINIINLL